MYLKVSLLLCLAAVVMARPQFQGQGQDVFQEPALYNFDWAVQDPESGNNFGHSEARDGDATSGQYYVDLPDGRRQMVTYRVDGESGFVVDVQYI